MHLCIFVSTYTSCALHVHSCTYTNNLIIVNSTIYELTGKLVAPSNVYRSILILNRYS